MRRPTGRRREPVVAALALAAAWWACAAANHPSPGFDRLHERAGGFDVWLPRWRFFAPEPVGVDLVLRYRLAPGPGDWRELPLRRDHRLAALLLDPGRRRRKAQLQVGRTVADRAADRDPAALAEHWCHRLLVAFVRAELRRRDLDRGAATVRFAIVRDGGHDPARSARVLYTSPDLPVADR